MAYNSQNLMKRRDNSNQGDSEDGIMKDVILTRRTTKVVKGGKKTSFSAMVVVGDKKGHIGVAMGKAIDVRTAVEKATRKAKKSMFPVNLYKTTIPHDVDVKYGASHIMLRPARKGTGMISSNVVRMALELAGIQDIVAKMHGTSNRITNTYCVMKALKELKPARQSRQDRKEAAAQLSSNTPVNPIIDEASEVRVEASKKEVKQSKGKVV